MRQAHAAVYAQRPDVDQVVVFGRTPQKLAKISGQFGFATTTDLDAVIADPSVDLIDLCLPTRLHADVAVRAMQAGRDVLIELPLAATLEGARPVVATQQATGRRVRGHVLPLQPRQPAPAPGRRRPAARAAAGPGDRRPHRGDRHATFPGAVLEYTMRAGYTGQGPSTSTEHTADGEQPIDLPAISPYEAMIDHVLACLTGRANNLIEPVSALPALELTLDIHQRLTRVAR